MVVQVMQRDVQHPRQVAHAALKVVEAVVQQHLQRTQLKGKLLMQAGGLHQAEAQRVAAGQGSGLVNLQGSYELMVVGRRVGRWHE